MPRIRANSIDEHKALTRRALLDAARQLIGQAGSVDVSLADVAYAAGVGRTTFYDYFSDREDVVAALVEEELPQVVEDLIASVDSELPIGERLGELASRMVEFVAADPVLGVILHREAGRLGADAQERIATSHSHLAAEMADLYRAGVADGVFRALPPGLAGMLIQDSIMAGARLLIAAGDVVDVGEVTAAVKVFLVLGLGSEG